MSGKRRRVIDINGIRIGDIDGIAIRGDDDLCFFGQSRYWFAFASEIEKSTQYKQQQ
jgi:hypothetical protein